VDQERDVVLRKGLLRIERAFQLAYRKARDGWTRGDRTVAFPHGTWWMRVHHNAEVLAAPE